MVPSLRTTQKAGIQIHIYIIYIDYNNFFIPGGVK